MIDENASVGDFTGRVAVVTGASSGVGLAAAHRFARLGAAVVLVGRDQDRLNAAVTAVREVSQPGSRPRGYPADFARLDDVRNLAAWLLDTYPSVDVLANNAGGVAQRREVTADGHELTMQVNHLAPFLLSNLLRDSLSGGRIVNTSSTVHRNARIDPDDLDGNARRYRAFGVYGATKLANVLFTVEATRRWDKIASYSYHPGVVRSRFGRGSGVMSAFYRYTPMLSTPEEGADTLVWLAGAGGSELTPGGYYAGRRLRQPSRLAADTDLAARLWSASERAVGLA